MFLLEKLADRVYCKGRAFKVRTMKTLDSKTALDRATQSAIAVRNARESREFTAQLEKRDQDWEDYQLAVIAEEGSEKWLAWALQD